MRKTLPGLFITLLVISPLYQPCTAQFMEIVGFASSIATLEQFVEVMYGKFVNGPEKADETLLAVDKMNAEVNYQLGEISKTLEELPSVIDHVSKRNKLQDHVNNIGFVFKSAVKMRKDIEAGNREDTSTYVNFRKELEHVIDKDIDEINHMLLDAMTTNFLTKTFMEGLRMYEDVCRTGRSHQQLLDGLLIKLKLALSEYYVTKNLMYEFVGHFRKDPHTFDKTKDNLRNKVQGMYSRALNEFKTMMTTASREVWMCDAPKTPRYQNKPDDPYYELIAFSKYIVNESVFASAGCIEKVQCRAMSNREVHSCGHIADKLDLCKGTRKCKNALVGCTNLHWSIDETSSVCINNDGNARNRYTGLVPGDQSTKLSCRDGRHETMKGYQYGGGVIPRFGSVIPMKWCNFCECICPENTYYISTAKQWNPIGFDGRAVMTGAKLVVEDQTIYVQIQQGKLMANGTIDKSTVEWVPLDKSSRVEIDWNGVSAMDTTSMTLPSDRVAIGMYFKQSKIYPRKIQLNLFSCKFDFKTGGLSTCRAEENEKQPKIELNLNNADVPTNSIKPNAPDSNEEQFVSITTSSMEKDGGQTTIPFIDTQKVVTNPPAPISGLGLYHRGQPGYGGFLALKIFTLDIVNYIPDNVVVPKL